MAAIPLLPFLVFIYYVKYLFGKSYCNHIDAIGEFKGMPEIVPETLNREFEINNELWFENVELNFSDIKYIFHLCRYFYAPYFIVKLVAKIARYSYTISHHTPRAIIVHDEYSYTSSVLTNYCEHRKVEHIDVMHGEKLYYIGNSFFRFTRTYIWGEHYRNLFLDLKACPDQFIIEIPRCFRINIKDSFDKRYSADYKYYLQIYTEDQLKSIISSMKFAEDKGAKVVYRPHPRFSNISLLERLVPKTQIEYPREVPIMASIASSKFIVGSFSTVLNQAYYSGKQIIFDDVTCLNEYNKLADLRYIFSKNDGLRLSSFQK